MTEAKITVQNINTPDRTSQVRRHKYLDMRAALLENLPADAPGMFYSEMKEAAKPLLSKELFPNGETSGWWMKCVQLDLEAKGVIIRVIGKPLRFHKT